MQVQPYLFFDGRCEEALAFYSATLGAKVTMLMRYKESPEPTAMMPPGSADKIMHASFTVGESTILASDGLCQGIGKMEGFSLSLTVADAVEAERLFTALSKDGQVRMPLSETFFSPSFGMVADRFGVGWMVYVEGMRP